MTLDLVNADTQYGITVATWRRDTTINLTLLPSDGSIACAFRFDHGEVTDRWMAGKGPCDENYHPLEEAS